VEGRRRGFGVAGGQKWVKVWKGEWVRDDLCCLEMAFLLYFRDQKHTTARKGRIRRAGAGLLK